MKIISWKLLDIRILGVYGLVALSTLIFTKVNQSMMEYSDISYFKALQRLSVFMNSVAIWSYIFIAIWVSSIVGLVLSLMYKKIRLINSFGLIFILLSLFTVIAIITQ